MPDWAACLETGHAGDLAALRLFPGIEFAEVGGTYWLRGRNVADGLEHELKKIPGLARFDLVSSDRLRPAGSRIPDRILPAANWRPLRETLVPALPVAALGGQTTHRIPISLVRTTSEQPASGLMIALDDWVAYANTAPLVRLVPLRFAAMEKREVLVLGNPLPPIPGRRYAAAEGLLVPSGFAWSPPVDGAVIAQLLGLTPEDVAVLADDGTHQVIHREQFVPASRSAARRTLAEWNNV